MILRLLLLLLLLLVLLLLLLLVLVLLVLVFGVAEQMWWHIADLVSQHMLLHITLRARKHVFLYLIKQLTVLPKKEQSWHCYYLLGVSQKRHDPLVEASNRNIMKITDKSINKW